MQICIIFVMKHVYLLFLIYSFTQEYDVEDSMLPLQPSLNYTAPELVRSKTNSFGCSSDIFSFGCVAYHLIARKPLFDCNNNVNMVPSDFSVSNCVHTQCTPSFLHILLHNLIFID